MTKQNNGKSRETPTRHSRFLLGVLMAGLLGARAIVAQEEQKGIDQDNYNIKQSVEFGYRFTDLNGSQETYDTMVNLQSGFRLSGFTTEMRSLDQHATFFDRLYFSNFGYGGDPNDVSQLRISKNKWYSFNAMFRKDQNYWDYSLLANPLNPPTAPANAPSNFNPILNAPLNVQGTSIVGVSPHGFYTRRNMQNYGLTILPDSKVRFRLGYDQTAVYGPGFSTLHQGTEQYLLENDSMHTNQYRLGVDFRFVPRTTISYDQIWTYYKDDPGLSDTNQQFSPGASLPPVDLGVSFNVGANQPCSKTFQSDGIVNPTCSAYSSYFSHYQTRIHSPTEKVTMQSTYFKNVDLAGMFSYTGGDLNVYNYQQNFTGLESRTNLSNYAESGPTQGRHVATFADFGATWHLTHDVTIVDSFHYSSWKEPAQYAASQCSYFSSSLIVPVNIFSPTATLPVTCAPPASGILDATPVHSTSSGADASLNLDSNFLKQENLTNTIEVRIDISPKVGVYVGYEYRHRVIADNFYNTLSAVYFPNNAARGNCALAEGVLPIGCTLNGDGSISYVEPISPLGPPGVTDINENHSVLGAWARPTQKLRFSFDADIMSANNTFTTYSPLSYQEFRVKADYKAASWVSVSGNISIYNSQNNVTNVNGFGHNRSYGFSVQLQPTEKFSLDLGYNYNSIYSQLLICFTATGSEPGLPACPGVTGLVQQLSPYSSNVNTGFIDFSWNVLSRLTLHGGANLSGASGSDLNLAPLSPVPTSVAGSLNSQWYQPYGGADYRIAKRWTGRAMWDYYGYHENATAAYQNIYAPRNFRGNLVMLSLRYAF